MNAVQQMIHSESDAIFFDMNVDNETIDLEECIEQEEDYEENSEGDEEVVKENENDDVVLGEEKSRDNVPFFNHIDAANDDVTSSWSLLQPTVEWTPSVELKKGLTFKDKADLKRAVQLYSIKRHRMYEVVETKSNVWALKCAKHKEGGCCWRLRACKRKSHQLFEITKYDGPHRCLYQSLSRDHPMLDSNLLAREIENQVKVEPSITVAALIETSKEKFSYDVSYKKMWNAKQKAIHTVFGDWDKSYKTLPKFVAALEKCNDMIVVWQFEKLHDQNMGTFQRIFWAFPQSVEGFKYCRPVISIDGTHLYGRYKGKMLIAMAVDGNNQLFPLSFAIVEEESFDSWSWFLHCLRQKVTQRKGVCLISDRHKGITSAVNDPYSMWREPWGYHRYCLRHICSNFNDKFHNKQLKVLVYRAGSAHQVRKFDAIIQEIDKINPEARKWLDKIPVAQWSLAHDGGRRYGIMTTNLSEVFNSVLKGARNLPITACVQLTFYRLVKFFSVRRGFVEDALAKRYLYTPHVLATIEGYRVKANTHDIVHFDRAQGVCEVLTAPYGEGMQKGHNKQVVHLAQKTCSCGKWQI
ncbi:unnamed protein product [Cuscuta epithymum]|uniref:Transposase MuDR plant domain-containing protein n=1 Tax=Cuscuta epithymum TaxID=186058 RepID=A0AAV0DGK0_9ASTE|nr:unnamed protein product [Cuscuta epithymum]